MAASNPSSSTSQRHFSCAAGDADRAAALDPGDLPGDAADRPGGARDDDGLTRLGPADVEQAEVGGQAADAEGAEMDRGRREGRVHPGHAASVRHRVALHPEDAVHLVAHREVAGDASR